MNGSYTLVGTSAIIRHVQHLVFKTAESHSTVLITGESGTGKDVIARMIHDRSTRNTFPFIPVKCASSSEEQLEIELFGHPTGTQHSGAFVQAKNGSIYLDEVARLTPRLQSILFKVLNEGVQHTLPEPHLQARLIVSSSVDIEQLVRRGAFREDLFYKMAACSIYLPPLRERREDIPILCEYFIQKYNQIKGRKILGIANDALNALLQNPWNYNLQELENLIERIVVLKTTGSIEVCDLPPRLRNLVTDNIDEFYDRQREASQHQAVQSFQNATAALSQNQMHVANTKLRENLNTQNTSHNFTNNHREDSFSPTFTKHNIVSSSISYNQQQNNSQQNFSGSTNNTSSTPSFNRSNLFEDTLGEIDQFIKKEIDLGGGIDFYRVVEEFENRLISEALRRTNHNKNRAAQLLSMNRTTLVEKLKKRASSNHIRGEGTKVKRNAAFTIFDGLGEEKKEFDNIDFLNISEDVS